MARVNAQEFADKWKRRLSGATEDIKRGIDKVTIAPGQQAAAAQDRMLANTTAAISSGRWARKVGAVPLNDWKTAAKDKGAARVATGAAAAEAKMARVAQELLPAIDAAAAEANAMPKGTIEDSVNRAGAYMRRMRAWKESR